MFPFGSKRTYVHIQYVYHLSAAKGLLQSQEAYKKKSEKNTLWEYHTEIIRKGGVYFIIIKKQSRESPFSIKLLTMWFNNVKYKESFSCKIIFLPLLSIQDSHRGEGGTLTDSALNTSCWFQAQAGSLLPAGPAGPSSWQP